ncbi:MAG: hypothetical protein AAGF20_01395 [Pseudomonadota bacterium]
MSDDKVIVENVNHPGHTERVRRDKYQAMRDALLHVLPREAPGLTVTEVKQALRPALPEQLFPGGKTLGWWQKTVQLDLEAKGLVARSQTKPMRIYRTG